MLASVAADNQTNFLATSGKDHDSSISSTMTPNENSIVCSATLTSDQDCKGEDIKSVAGSSTDHCCAACAGVDGCGAFVFVSGGTYGNMCYLKSSCIPETGCASGSCTTGVMPTAAPTPSPPTPPTPPSPSFTAPRGCGVAIAGDWPNTGAQFDVSYNFDLTALMKNAQDVVGPAVPLWRYDWRSSEHPHTGPWTYISMDWCNRGGVGEHPNPSYSSPGLMGWNEPNVPSQCGTDPGDAQAVAEFVALAKEYKEQGKFVVSPAPSLDSPWLDTFLGQCSAQNFMDVDYLAYHHYVTCDEGTTGDAMYGEMEANLLNFINLMHKWNGQGFKIKGIWITEIACAPSGGWGNRPYHWTSDGPTTLMGKFVDLINNHNELQAWSWFPYGGFGQLWNDGSWTLTDLGQTYFGNCHQDRQPLAEQSNSTRADGEMSNITQVPISKGYPRYLRSQWR